MKTPRPGRRGMVLVLVLAVISAMVAILAVGQDARIRELGSEERVWCRLQARLAAESAIDRALTRLVAGGAPSFAKTSLGEGVDYGITATRSPTGWSLAGSGHCVFRAGETTRTLRVDVAKLEGRWRITRWDE